MLDWLMQQPVWLQAFFATLFTWGMTALGAAVVFVSGRFNERTLNAMQGTAAGIMIAASFFRCFCLPKKGWKYGAAAHGLSPSSFRWDFYSDASLFFFPTCSCRG